MPVTHILFDLDGTLTDPKSGITRSIQYALQRLHAPVPAIEELTWCIGPPLLESFPILLNTDDPVVAKQALTLYRERFSTLGKFENDVYPDIPELLERLHDQGFHLFVATSKPRVFAVDIVEHFDLTTYFTGIYGSELDGQFCEKTMLLPHILRHESLDPLNTIMVGDRKHDILGAKSCNLRSIGVLYGYGSREELHEAGADFLAEAPLKILDGIEPHSP